MHTAYERFLDIKPHRKRKIHTRFVFGAYNTIARHLMYGLAEEVAESIRKQTKGTEA